MFHDTLVSFAERRLIYMPVGLKFQRKHRFLGYKLKYIYYFIARRNVLQKKKSYGKCNADKVIYIIKPDYQDGVEGLL